MKTFLAKPYLPFTLILLALLSFSPVRAQTYISEYFNGYGESDIKLETVAAGGGTGWQGNWTRPSGGTAASYSNYMAGAIVAPVLTGYSSAGNLTGSGNGTAGGSSITSSLYNTHRATGPLTGEIWISVAYRVNGFSDGGATTLIFDSNAFAAPNSITLFNSPNAANQGSFVYNSSGTSLDRNLFNPANGVDYLLLARIDMNYNESGHDRLSIWLTMTDVTSLATIGSAFFVGEGADVFGESFGFIGLNVRGDSRLDAIRISDAPDAFHFVTTGTAIPEPSTYAIITSFVVMGVVLWRRRRIG